MQIFHIKIWLKLQQNSDEKLMKLQVTLSCWNFYLQLPNAPHGGFVQQWQIYWVHLTGQQLNALDQYVKDTCVSDLVFEN